jgi:hypothetical protein
MNELQKRLILATRIKETMLAETFINYPNEQKNFNKLFFINMLWKNLSAWGSKS